MDHKSSVTASAWEIELLMKIRKLNPEHQVSLKAYIDNILNLTIEDSKDVSLVAAAD